MNRSSIFFLGVFVAVSVFASQACDRCNPETVTPDEVEPIDPTDSAISGGSGSNGTDGEPDDSCLLTPDPALTTYRYQCNGSFEAEISASGKAFPLTAPFGNGVADDPYDNPHVMACCTGYRQEPLCGQPHELACYVDLVAQGCRAISFRIHQAGDEQEEDHPDFSNQLHLLANWVTEHQQECFNVFAKDTDLVGSDVSCSPEIGYSNKLANSQWSLPNDGFNWPLLTGITVKILSAEITDIYPEAAPANNASADDTADSGGNAEILSMCESARDNDNEEASFLELPPSMPEGLATPPFSSIDDIPQKVPF